MRILWIGAHPDDEVFVSGWLAYLRLNEGAEIGFLVATRGERGDWKLPGIRPPDIDAIREEETRRSASFLHAAVLFADCPDGVAAEPEDVLREWSRRAGGAAALRRRFSSLIRSFGPDRIVTFNRHHGCTWHADHRAVGTLVQSLRLPIPVTLVESRILLTEGLRVAPAAGHAKAFDATGTWNFVIQTVESHPSQFGPEMVEVFRRAPDDAKIIWLSDAGRWQWWHYIRDTLVRRWSRLKSFVRDGLRQ